MECMAASINLFIEYDLSIVHLLPYVPVQPVASECIRIICAQTVVLLCVQPVLQPYGEHGLVVWCVAVGAVRC
jgi:hypothetical protein